MLFCFERQGADEHSPATTRCLYSLFPRGGAIAPRRVLSRSARCPVATTMRGADAQKDLANTGQQRPYARLPLATILFAARNDCASSGFSRHLGTPLCLAFRKHPTAAKPSGMQYPALPPPSEAPFLVGIA